MWLDPNQFRKRKHEPHYGQSQWHPSLCYGLLLCTFNSECPGQARHESRIYEHHSHSRPLPPCSSQSPAFESPLALRRCQSGWSQTPPRSSSSLLHSIIVLLALVPQSFFVPIIRILTDPLLNRYASLAHLCASKLAAPESVTGLRSHTYQKCVLSFLLSTLCTAVKPQSPARVADELKIPNEFAIFSGIPSRTLL